MISLRNVLSSANRFCTIKQTGERYITTAAAPLCFRLTQAVAGEPLKKKKKLDPMLVRHKEERRKKKIEKAIRRLEKNAGQLKPLEELEVPRTVLQEIENSGLNQRICGLRLFSWTKPCYHSQRRVLLLLPRLKIMSLLMASILTRRLRGINLQYFIKEMYMVR
ncbi:hypothetical protein OTU49_012331 [Cherax quadricarinatus]|uniref:Large ribosomal subunit protein mL40 n=1 Tax=Cherax quadricarinatus TaxID=27406 RepID=A0AAW0VZ81_CHEQU|nr:uncharacterized protein LOC128701741 isoform X2 [Cherax quadricarinatus]